SPPPYATFNLGFATDDNEANVASNRARFCEALELAPETLVAAHLHHGNAVAVFRRDQLDTWPVQTVPVRAGSHRTMRVFSADGVVSDAPGLFFFMTFADCVPLVFVDRTRGVV